MALGLLLAGAVWLAWGTARERPRLALFTSLPILWAEAAGPGPLLDSAQSPHWARARIEARFRPVAYDTLSGLARDRFLLMAQPRPLMPQENVALDGWVRGGGRLLLLADPLLTEDSRFALGDPRRPQDVVLLSPILARWGLELRFDEDQLSGLRESAGRGIPINAAGAFAPHAGGMDAACTIEDDGLVARCRIGRGHALIVADAALLERDDAGGRRARALDSLLDEAFR